ncbi:S41 family peptidase [uncultured Fibrobacter sp.]|uniref:S41 family peptidase n=1 Tax=uncultured Fibrobacter sp. TaxID=261512 RepID=UPI0025DA1910|nr:S41 family peptidase [uncultured Fibrobacter sp.]
MVGNLQIASPCIHASLGERAARNDKCGVSFAFRHFLALLSSLVFLTACSDFMSPVKETPAPTEYQFNYWLLNRTYLFEDELDKLDPDGDSVQALYKVLDDPYTRYVPPSKSEATTQQMNTSIVEGDLGMEYMLAPDEEHPLFVYRVYPESPAAKAGVPRYGNIISINGREITDIADMAVYDSIVEQTMKITLKIAIDDSIHTYKMKKETIYAPTVFVDTIDGMEYIQITEFKLTTLDQKDGSLGELRSHLDSTSDVKDVRVLDLRNNPGGHVSQCVGMADLFVKKGMLSSRHWRSFNGEGKAIHFNDKRYATTGDPGENGKFLILVNRNSASCAEIFTSAVTELAPIPVVGQTTFGKGIGQTTWNTKDGALAIITNLEFITPKGNSYNKTGIEPDYPCDSFESIYDCVADAAKSEFGKKKSGKASILPRMKIIPKKRSIGGAHTESEDDISYFSNKVSLTEE